MQETFWHLTFDLHHEALAIQQSLGTTWCIEDTLGFCIELKDKPLINLMRESDLW